MPFTRGERIAFIVPLAMAVAATALIPLHLMLVGPVPQADEGAAARLWQLLMLGQIPAIAYAAALHLRRDVRRGGLVVGLHLAVWCAALAPILILEA